MLRLEFRLAKTSVRSRPALRPPLRPVGAAAPPSPAPPACAPGSALLWPGSAVGLASGQAKAQGVVPVDPARTRQRYADRA